MRLARLIEYLRARLKAVTMVCLVVLVLLALADIFLAGSAEAHTKIEHFPAFWSIFGFVGCVLIIILSKWFGHLGIMTREDYYDHGTLDAAADRSAAFRRQNGGSGDALPPEGGAPQAKDDHTSKGGHDA
jgi:hypothetical protein